MSKKKRSQSQRKWVAKKQPPQDIWLEEDDELRGYFAFIQKLHPETTPEEAIQGLVDLGYLSVRTNAAGKREYRANQGHIREALAKLPDEIRNDPREIKIYEDTAIICEYDHEMATLLSVITQQTDKLLEHETTVPWITKTQDQLLYDTMGTVKDFQKTLTQLEARNFVEITQNGPEHYRYRLNVPVVQAALDALPER